ncbi:D-alanine-D-alanine ligase [Pseudonocardia sediminis]|uniref:D-alanine-D-alanine ligase n=1 Tax=Pseudonocardia sediminis TaxID=1397368 RepID=A0A4Q7V1F4_PSEST|nr:D-alanine--D-alanine ligase [Pseudonocardia sediminis]RZT87151.1 D-alanine-D-alanine ligase [Pseudonocardia sediminis]
MKQVLFLVGSAVDEFHAELSRLYARDALTATADPGRYAFHIAYVTPDGRWRFPDDLGPEAIGAAESMPLSEAVQVLTGLRIDVMVPQMFCVPGMTHYRALFDLLGIPYVGNRPDVMALGADKAKARAVVAAAGVGVPAGEQLRPGDLPSISPPVVIKPVDTDNSVGVTLVRDDGDHDVALKNAFTHSGSALVEEFVELGREVRCGVVERDGELVCLPLEEYDVDADAKPIRLAEDKLARNADGELNLMAKTDDRAWILDPSDPVTEAVWDAAKKCHVALGCRHYSLFDFRIDPTGTPWFLEAGLYCSFARTSVVAVMADAAGTQVRDLFRDLVEDATG